MIDDEDEYELSDANYFHRGLLAAAGIAFISIAITALIVHLGG
jgi:hypothetical protein